MGHTGDSALGRRWRRARGFRLSSARFSVLRLRLRRLAGIIRLLGRCVDSLRKSLDSTGAVGSSCGGAGRRRRQSAGGRGRAWEPLGSSNSFYADAIADCLEFIKRTSVSLDGDEAAAAVAACG